jgi:hypothetical protein
LKQNKIFKQRGTAWCLLLLLAGLLIACSPGEDEFVLKGNIKDMKTAEIYAVTPGGEHVGLDTIQVKGDEFEYRITLTEPAVLLLQYANYQQQVVFAEPGQSATLSGMNSRLAQVKVEGTPENDAFTAYRLSVLGKSDAQKRKAAETYIRQQPERLSALYLLEYYFLSEEADLKTALELADSVHRAQPDRVRAGRILSLLETAQKNVKGKSIAPLQLIDIDGKKVTNKDFGKSGKDLLVLFWASWDTESSTVINVLEAQTRQMRTDNREVPVDILTLALDGNAYEGMRRMQRREIPGRHVVLTDAWEDPLVKRFGVTELPYAILYDSKLKVKKHLRTREEILGVLH